MAYDLYRGPTPGLRTFDEWWQEVLGEKWRHDHITISKPVFVGQMPMRQDLLVIPLTAESGEAFVGWETVGMVIRWVKPKWWHPLWRLWWRIKRVAGLAPKPDTEPRLI